MDDDPEYELEKRLDEYRCSPAGREYSFTCCFEELKKGIHDRFIARCRHFNDSNFDEACDWLLAHPNSVTEISICWTSITDVTGIKLANVLRASITLEKLHLILTQITEKTYYAIAAALHTNTSLEILGFHNPKQLDTDSINASFAAALRINPNRPELSWWVLYETDKRGCHFEYLQKKAKQLGHPTLQMILNHELEKKFWIRPRV